MYLFGNSEALRIKLLKDKRIGDMGRAIRPVKTPINCKLIIIIDYSPLFINISVCCYFMLILVCQ